MCVCMYRYVQLVFYMSTGAIRLARRVASEAG